MHILTPLTWHSNHRLRPSDSEQWAKYIQYTLYSFYIPSRYHIRPMPIIFQYIFATMLGKKEITTYRLISIIKHTLIINTKRVNFTNSKWRFDVFFIIYWNSIASTFIRNTTLSVSSANITGSKYNHVITHTLQLKKKNNNYIYVLSNQYDIL
jgi:hypothetical protein